MRLRLILALAAAVSVFLVVGVAGTAALWREQTELNAGTITTGSLLLLNGSQTSQVKNYQLSEFSSGAIEPGVSRQAPVVVKNAGTTGFLLNLNGITASVAGGSASLLASFKITISQVSAVADCPVGPAIPVGQKLFEGTQQPDAVFSSRPKLDAGASMVLCLQGMLSNDAPQPADQLGFQLYFGFRADQNR